MGSTNRGWAVGRLASSSSRELAPLTGVRREFLVRLPVRFFSVASAFISRPCFPVVIHQSNPTLADTCPQNAHLESPNFGFARARLYSRHEHEVGGGNGDIIELCFGILG